MGKGKDDTNVVLADFYSRNIIRNKLTQRIIVFRINNISAKIRLEAILVGNVGYYGHNFKLNIIRMTTKNVLTFYMSGRLAFILQLIIVVSLHI
jgi:hypothetical protein